MNYSFKDESYLEKQGIIEHHQFSVNTSEDHMINWLSNNDKIKLDNLKNTNLPLSSNINFLNNLKLLTKNILRINTNANFQQYLPSQMNNPPIFRLIIPKLPAKFPLNITSPTAIPKLTLKIISPVNKLTIPIIDDLPIKIVVNKLTIPIIDDLPIKITTGQSIVNKLTIPTIDDDLPIKIEEFKKSVSVMEKKEIISPILLEQELFGRKITPSLLFSASGKYSPLPPSPTTPKLREDATSPTSPTFLSGTFEFPTIDTIIRSKLQESPKIIFPEETLSVPQQRESSPKEIQNITRRNLLEDLTINQIRKRAAILGLKNLNISKQDLISQILSISRI